MGICNQAGVSTSGTTIASKQGVASVNTCSELTLFLSDQLRREPRVLGLRLHLSPRVKREERMQCRAEQACGRSPGLSPELSPTHVPSSPWLVGGYYFSQ